MGGRNDDKDQHGFPENVFEEMQKGHEKFMRDLQEEGRRFQQDLEDTKPSPLPGGKNFFGSLRDFVDSNLSSLADSFRELPANMAELKAKVQEERERRQQEELDVWRRWTGIEESPDHCQMIRERASAEQRQEAVDAASMLLREARDRNAHIPKARIEALYRDEELGSLDSFASPMLSPGGACYYKSDNGYNAPSTAIFRFGAPNYRWLSVDWFKRSPYSPISLEHHPDMQNAGTKWRGAFEDLLNAALDKPMASREQVGLRPPYGMPQSTRTGPGLDWMLSLQCRGILPPQLPSWWAASHTHKWTLSNKVLDAQMRNPFEISGRDVQQLVDEIATPPALSGVEESTYHDMTELAFLEQLEEADAKARQQLEAQKQLEESARQQRLASSSVEPEQEVWIPTGNKQEDAWDAQDYLFAALEKNDLKTATQWLNTWHEAYGNVGDLIEEPLSDHASSSRLSSPAAWYPVLNEALRRSELPDTDFWRRMAYSPENEQIEKHDQLSLAEKRERRKLIRRGDKAAGQLLEWPLFLSFDELREMVERLEQEAEALGLDEVVTPVDTCSSVSPRSSVQATDEKAAKKVDVLSSLTTTQTTRLPDGTITTKVVLKQRFADGREETEEKIHTYQEVPQPQQQGREQDPEPKKKNGWFWS